MRLFLTIFCLLASSLSWAKPAQLEGEYKFNGGMQPLQTIHWPVVYGRSNDGRLEIAKLRDKGYICVHKYRGFYRCKKFMAPDLPEKIAERILTKVEASGSLIFGDFMNSNLEIDGESYKEWKVFQKVSFAGESYEFYKYSELDNGRLRKISFGNFRNGTGVGFVVEDNGLARMHIDRSKEFQYMTSVKYSAE